MTAAIKGESLRHSGHANLLKEAGFSVISRIALLLCRLRLLDIARTHKRILTRRPLSLVSFVGGLQKTTVIELTVNTTNPETERRAATAGVRYFTIFGRQLVTTPEGCQFNLFADPIGTRDPQRLYSDPPAHAFWSVVTIQRQTEERRIGIEGSLRPRPLKQAEPLAFEAALISRDRRSLEYHVQRAQDNRNRSAARQLLSRMIFLARRPDDIRHLRFIADTDHVMADLAVNANVRIGTAAEKFAYSGLLTMPFDNRVPLSKWLASEGISLNAEVSKQGTGVSEVVITPGVHWGLRVLAAAYAGYPVFVEDIRDDAGGGQEKIPWIKHQELLSFISPP